MKIRVIEDNNGSYYLDITAETVEDAVMITRFKLNTKKEPPMILANAFRNGTFKLGLIFSVKKDTTSDIGAT